MRLNGQLNTPIEVEVDLDDARGLPAKVEADAWTLLRFDIQRGQFEALRRG